MSDTEAVIAWHARRSDLLDWLLGAAVQSAYPIFAADQMERERGWPWRKPRDWQEAPDFSPLAARYWARYQADGGLEWAVLAMLFPLDDAQAAAADQLYDQWLARLNACVASPAEYAAFATVYFERSSRDVWKAPSAAQDRLIGLLPPRMQDVMIARAARAVLARQVVSGSWRSGRPDLDDARQSLASYAAFEADDPRRNAEVVQEIRLLFADNIADVADLLVELDSPERFVRDINLLSVSNLQVLAADTRLPEAMRIDLARLAFLRLFALGRDTEAAEALGRFFELDPEAKAAAKTAANLTAAPEVKLALIALSMPELSTRYKVGFRGARDPMPGFRSYYTKKHLYGADLPDWLRTGGGLQADVQRLLQVGRFWFSQKGYDYAAMRRLSDRSGGGLFLPEPRFAGFPPLGPYDPGVPFGRLVALDELARLGPDTGLSQRLSEVVIAWADAGSDTLPEMIMQQSGPMPDALSKIVQLNRYRWRGDVDGVFAGKAAFRLLHDRFALTAAARTTPYWFVCTGGYCDR